jgi:hypothetical protein
MKLLGWFAIGLLIGLFARAGFAAEPELKPESKHDKDIAACNVEANNALAKTVMKSPADVTKVKSDAFNICLRSKGYATGTIRAK